ncbi:hypothetical protein LMH73_004565 [Vibrio splendidus]|nr:hypothetical protein [Vibrio splendidus]MCC4883293.1 hypothetical protein [Vibrio splendidus]
MKTNIPLSIVFASVGAISIVAAHQKLNVDEEVKKDESVTDLIGKLEKLDSDNNASVVSAELINALSDENNELLGFQVNEVLATSDWSQKFNPSGFFESAPTGNAAVSCYSNCHSNCHGNCHGSRSWR